MTHIIVASKNVLYKIPSEFFLLRGGQFSISPSRIKLTTGGVRAILHLGRGRDKIYGLTTRFRINIPRVPPSGPRKKVPERRSTSTLKHWMIGSLNTYVITSNVPFYRPQFQRSYEKRKLLHCGIKMTHLGWNAYRLDQVSRRNASKEEVTVRRSASKKSTGTPLHRVPPQLKHCLYA